MICHRTANYKLQRDVTQNVHIQELWFLHSACHRLVRNVCMMIYEYILNSYRADTNVSQKVQRDVTQKVWIQELRFLRSARHLMLVNICLKFHEDTLNGSKVTERTRFCLTNCYLQSSKGHKRSRMNKSYGYCSLHVVIWCLIFVWSFIRYLERL